MTPLARVRIAARFNGPPASGNGGYSSGVLGTLIGDSAEVTLRKPPPLERELSIEVERAGGSGTGAQQTWRMIDGDAVIATGRVAEPDVVCPQPPTPALAREAEAHYAGFQGHVFPTCFVCGTERAPGDGLRLFTGKVEGREIVASAWTPAASLGIAGGTVDRCVVWSALDCPTYFGGRLNGYSEHAVLGRLTAKLVSDVEVGVPHVVVGWPLGRDGRKWEGGAAIFTERGELRAYARGLWVELKQAQ
jgi:hypothetical protein